MKDFIDDLFSDNSVDRIIDQDGNIYGILVLGRGENMFFQENNLGLICSIDIINCGIERKSINKWNNGIEISEEEKERILPKMIEMFEKFYSRGKPVTVR